MDFGLFNHLSPFGTTLSEYNFQLLVFSFFRSFELDSKSGPSAFQPFFSPLVVVYELFWQDFLLLMFPHDPPKQTIYFKVIAIFTVNAHPFVKTS